MSIHQALIEAARQLCAVKNTTCQCRDDCDMGTCSEVIEQARSTILTFMAHPEVRNTPGIMEKYSELKQMELP